MKKLILLLLSLLLLSGCTSLGKLEDKDSELTIDIRDNFDPMTILKDVKEGTEATYELDEVNSKLIITLSNGDKTQTIEKDITIQYPLATFKEEDITIDVYLGYDINDLMNVTEGTELSSELDQENSLLLVEAVNGDRNEKYEKEVNVIDTTPTPFGRTYARHLCFYDRDKFDYCYNSEANDDYHRDNFKFIDETYCDYHFLGNRNAWSYVPPEGVNDWTQSILERIRYVNEDFSYFELEPDDLYNGYTGELSKEVSCYYFVEITD
ncbi:MAG: hypothetical protein Q4B60_09400 [Erysipelotrichaceae bacterium]|nr:hypothetical protein [Erysipelotrichaceae bacterium]